MEKILRPCSSLHMRPDPDEPLYCKRVKLNPTNNFNDHTILLKKFVFEKLVQKKKLSLVLDLDHTLLHTVAISCLRPEDRDLVLKETYDPSLSSLFRIKLSENSDFITKLRPGLRHFLEETSKMFKLHVFTKGSRDYAMEILKLIDPGNYYFGCKSSSSSRVFTRESCVGKKSLDLVMGKENGILIVDDKKSVWRDVDEENVLEIPEYDFFKLRSGSPRLSGGLVEGSDESEIGGWLVTYLGILKEIHTMFFDPQGKGHVMERDVRVLKNKLSDSFGTVVHTSLSTHSTTIIRPSIIRFNSM